MKSWVRRLACFVLFISGAANEVAMGLSSVEFHQVEEPNFDEGIIPRGPVSGPDDPHVNLEAVPPQAQRKIHSWFTCSAC